MTPNRAIWSIGLGLGWGGLAALLGGRAIGSPIWFGVAASPFIGLLMARLTIDAFDAGSGGRRAAIAFGGLVLGAVLFGIAIGIGDLVQHPGQLVVATLAEGVAGVLWGVFVTGFFLFLFPLAYASCWLLARLD